MKRCILVPIVGLAVASFAAPSPTEAGIVNVYSNDFETNTDGFDVSHTEELPNDAVGGTSMYLGQRTPGSTLAVLTLTGLTPGAIYDIAFDLYIGGTWDGSVSFGPDFFSLTSSSAGTLINATFRNGFPIGDSAPVQSYSDATPLGGGGLFRTREGADIELAEAIYYFGHGAGNPVLSFTAAGTIETLTFASQDAQLFTTDEFFAIDNVVVSTEMAAAIPEPSAVVLLALGIGLLSLSACGRKKTQGTAFDPD